MIQTDKDACPRESYIHVREDRQSVLTLLGAGEIVQQLRVCAVFTEDLRSSKQAHKATPVRSNTSGLLRKEGTGPHSIHIHTHI